MFSIRVATQKFTHLGAFVAFMHRFDTCHIQSNKTVWMKSQTAERYYSHLREKVEQTLWPPDSLFSVEFVSFYSWKLPSGRSREDVPAVVRPVLRRAV